PIGLLAGSGRFPILVAEKTRRLGIPIVCVGIRGEAAPELASLVDRFYWAGIAKLGRMIRLFKRERVQCVVMAAKIPKLILHPPCRVFRYLPVWRGLRFLSWRRRPDNRDDSMLLGVIAEFAADGLTFASALDLCPELLVGSGVLTRRAPTRADE